jgi:predicted permease
MNWWQRLLRKSYMEDRLDAELRYHFERQVADNLRSGMPEEEARRAARLEFGGLDKVKEDCRDARGTQWVESTLQDIRFALRGLRRSPGFAMAAIGTLALGIGANTAIFSVVYAVLLKPLPYARPDRLVSILTIIPQMRSRFPSLPLRAQDFLEFQKTNTVFSGMSAITPTDFNLTGSGEPERLSGARVSANLFTLLGTEPQQGRGFLPEEDEPGRDRVIVISHALWLRRFGGDPGALNRVLSLDGQDYQVVGILPEDLLFPTGKQIHTMAAFGPRVDVFKPMAFTHDELTTESFSWGAVARLKPGVSMAAARQQLDGIALTIVQQLRKQDPGLDVDLRTQLQPIREVFSGSARGGLIVLLGAVGLLLVIACVNLANLLLARMTNRGREFAARAALGAPGGRLVRQLLTESLAISALGGAAGLLVAWCGTSVLTKLAPADLPAVSSLPLNLPVLLFTMAAALLTGMAFGLAPAFGTARVNLHEQLKEGSRAAGTGLRAKSLRRVLVTVEVALSTGLLAVAGLLLHSFVNVMNVDKGFTAENILAAKLSLEGKNLKNRQVADFYRQLVEHVRTLPGVAAAGAVSALPLSESGTRMVYLDSDTAIALDRPIAGFRIVTPGYFSTMGIRLLSGRFLSDQEPAPAAVIGADLARRLWPGEPVANAVGKRVCTDGPKGGEVTIVGVAADVRTGALEREPTPGFYRPHSQFPSREMTLVVRTIQEPQALATAVRAEAWKLDRNLPISEMKTMREIVSASVAARRFQTMLVVLFAALSLVLALVGIYGVTSYSVARQTQEIGLRMALGAQGSNVLRSVLVQGLQPVVVGLVCGLIAARLGAVAVRSFLFGIGPLDPLALGGVACVLLFAAVLACYLPARKASRLDPVIALRCE